MRISDWSSDVCSSDLAALHKVKYSRDERPGLKLTRSPIVTGVSHREQKGNVGLSFRCQSVSMSRRELSRPSVAQHAPPKPKGLWDANAGPLKTVSPKS